MEVKKKPALFKFKPLSKKQRQVFNWWMEDSPVKDKAGIIADGSIRSGKTTSMSLSYVLWAMTCFNNQTFIMCGKTISSFRRNVLKPLKLMLFGRGYKVVEHRSENMFAVHRIGNKEKQNEFYIFGGKDESSQDLVQGLTAAGAFFDEVALMPESFVNQATGRCSVEGAKLWFNCNPDNPEHWFKKNWIDKIDVLNLIFLHFKMEDNLSLSKEVIESYYRRYVGVFFKRFILGLWVAAEGLLFPQYADDPVRWELSKLPNFIQVNFGVDIGGTKSHTPIIATGIEPGFQGVVSFYENKVEHAKGIVDVALICKTIEQSISAVTMMGYYPKHIFVDNAEQVIINSIRSYLKQRGYVCVVVDCRKFDSKTRILAYNLLLNQNKMRFYNTPSLKKSLSSAMYNPKSKVKDEILDDFTTDIDTFDAHFYSFSYFLEKFGLYIKA